MSDPYAELERLVDALGAPGVSDVARQRAAELVGVLLGIHQDAVEALVELLDDTGRVAAADDPRIAPILLLHGLHPDPVDERIAQAVDETRRQLAPALQLDVRREGSAVTVDVVGPGAGEAGIRAAFERAVLGAAPECDRVEVRVSVPVELSSRDRRTLAGGPGA